MKFLGNERSLVARQTRVNKKKKMSLVENWAAAAEWPEDFDKNRPGSVSNFILFGWCPLGSCHNVARQGCRPRVT
jgi:hypothetical protein